MRRTPDTLGNIKYNTQDPLFFDYANASVNGGIPVILQNIKDKGTYKLPLRNLGFVLYHIAKNDIYDPDLFQKFEETYREITSTSMTARHNMGGVYGYYRSNQGTRYGLDYWEEHLQKNSQYLHVVDIAELVEGFSLNRTLPREYFRQKLTEVHKPVLIQNWKKEATYHQRMLYTFCKRFHELQYYDEELWHLIVNDVEKKLKINNSTFFAAFYEAFTEINKDPKNPFYKKLDSVLKVLTTKHYTKDRQWRYSLEDGGKWKSWQELKENRESSKLTDFLIKKPEVDQKVLEQAKAVERKLKRLRMAKLSKDLFDEIVSEMIKEKRSLMEMMAELDVDDQAIYDAQERIAKRNTQN